MTTQDRILLRHLRATEAQIGAILDSMELVGKHMGRHKDTYMEIIEAHTAIRRAAKSIKR